MAEKDILNKIRASIKENLPEEVGLMVRKELEALEKIREDYDALQVSYDYLEENFNEAQIENGKLHAQLRIVKEECESFKKENAQLKAHDEEVQEAKRNMLVEFSNLKAEEAEKRANSITDLVGALVKNPAFMHKVMDEN